MTHTVGTKVRVRLSDAPEFTATIITVQEDPKFGISYRIECRNGAKMWVTEYRIVSVLTVE